jgi:DNA-directed RNA polymerase subunit RPC12/RpoP
MIRWIDRGILSQEEGSTQQASRLAEWKMPPIITPGAPVPAPLQVVAVSRIQNRPRIVCPNCGSVDSFRVKSTQTYADHVRQYGRCADSTCRWPAVKIIRNTVENVRWGANSAMLD